MSDEFHYKFYIQNKCLVQFMKKSNLVRSFYISMYVKNEKLYRNSLFLTKTIRLTRSNLTFCFEETGIFFIIWLKKCKNDILAQNFALVQ